MHRCLLVLCSALLVLALLPGTAAAHASFDVTQVPAGGRQDLTLRVPVERDAGNDQVAIRVPVGFEVEACDGAPGWTCATDSTDEGTVVTLTRTEDGDPATERFGLALATPPESGLASFPVVQTYDDGEQVAWIGEEGTERPAPQIRVGDAPAAAAPTPTPTHGSAPDSGAAAAPSTRDDPAPPAEDPADGLLLVLLGTVAAVAGVAAVAWRLRSRDR